MNDVISLESVRRGRGRPQRADSRAEAPVPAADMAREAVAETSVADVVFREPVEFPAPPEVGDEERLDRISDTVVRALGRRQLSSAETRELLVAQGADDSEAEALVARFEELGYLDDFALAEALVARLSERSHKSRAVIGRELSARKIPGEFVTAALEQLDDEAEFTLALEAATKRASQLTSYDEQTAERRLMGFLTRRGFGSSVVREATRRALAGRRSVAGPRFR